MGQDQDEEVRLVSPITLAAREVQLITAGLCAPLKPNHENKFHLNDNNNHNNRTIKNYEGDAGIDLKGREGEVIIEGYYDDRTRNKLIVQGDQKGSGIGSSLNGSEKSIIIRNCTVVANVGQGDSPAAIGSREGSSCGDIVIENCEITTNAAIGSGKQGQCGDITIKNSTITTNGGGVGGYGTHGTIKYIKSTVDGTYYENETIPATP